MNADVNKKNLCSTPHVNNMLNKLPYDELHDVQLKVMILQTSIFHFSNINSVCVVI